MGPPAQGTPLILPIQEPARLGPEGGWGRPKPCQVHTYKVGAQCSELRLWLFTTQNRVCDLGAHIHAVVAAPLILAESATLSASGQAPPFHTCARISGLTGFHTQLLITSCELEQDLSLSATRTFGQSGRPLQGCPGCGTPPPPTRCQDTAGVASMDGPRHLLVWCALGDHPPMEKDP